MQPETIKLLEDVRASGRRVLNAVAGQAFDRYRDDWMFRAAIERELITIGEAISRLCRVDAATAARIPEYRRIVDFRNLLVHGYAEVDEQLVWQIIHLHLPRLVEVVIELRDDRAES